MRTFGIDLAVKASHKAVVIEEGEFVTPFLKFKSTWDEIERLVARAREGLEPDHPIQAVMEPRGMAWFTVALPLLRMAGRFLTSNFTTIGKPQVTEYQPERLPHYPLLTENRCIPSSFPKPLD
jgi:hypothetical protein